jgi:succinoglycan biosynthesis protein ExoA
MNGPGPAGPTAQAAFEIPSLPFVSVIMPVRNEAGFIERSLGSVLAQDYSRDRMEVVIADGMSDDGTRELVHAAARRDGRVRLVDNEGRIAPTALNAALAGARGTIIVRVDGHTEIASDYVRQCVQELERTGADNVGGRMEAEGSGTVRQAIAAATSSPFGVGGARFHYSEAEEWVDTVYLGAWRRATFDSLGLFDEELVRNQDDEFNYRIRAAGGRILLSPKIRSRYYGRSSLSSLARQYFQYGLWKVRVLQKHPRQMRPRQFVPPVFVACLLAGAFAAPFAPWARHGLLGVGVAYAVANLVASFFSGRVGPFPEVLLLPIVFATLHVSYGVGFLTGLVRFRNRWSETTIGSPPAGRHEGSA